MRGQMTHPDTDVLAEFRAGLITGRRGARITAHLAGCDRCTALDDQLAGVSVLLASVPAPAMPDSVARRLDTALAAEVASRDNAERARGDGAAESPAPRRPDGHRGFRLLSLRVLAPAAAVVVLAAGGYGLSRLVGPGQVTASSAAGSATPSAASSGHANAPVAVPAKGGVSRLPGAVSRPQGITPTNFPLVTGQRNLSPANLAQQVKAALLVPATARTTKTPSTQLRGCVGTLASGHQLELVESVRFEGRPATLVVVKTGADETALIAAQNCSATNPHVLDRTSLTSGISGP